MGLDKQRKEMVEFLDKSGYIKYPALKKAMLKVPREEFVPEEYKSRAYSNTPFPIPGGVTISAEHMHAIMLSALKLKRGDKVLEVGAGSGIMLAYMKEIVGSNGKVFGIEIIPETYEFAKKNLEKTGYDKKVKMILGDGSLGLAEHAPFDKILSSASCREVPKPWIDQLKVGGIIITPVGPVYGNQELYYFEKNKKGELKGKPLGGVIFIPLAGKFGWGELRK